MSARKEGVRMTRESKDRQKMREEMKNLKKEGNTLSMNMRATQMELSGIDAKIELLNRLLGSNDDE